MRAGERDVRERAAEEHRERAGGHAVDERRQRAAERAAGSR